ncbi:MAG TPA: hypothetical protein VNM66_05925 [Thermodesulfobacteriota bacterium]|nr:hypothetical protein [Thermodesulfobacteriota bacterium]
MLLPAGVPLYRGLDTAFTNLRELLRALKGSRFYGYVKVQFPGYQGVLVCDAGDLVAAREDAGGELRCGREALAGVLARAAARGGEVSVVELPADLVYRWATCAHSRPVHRDLSTDFARLDKLLADLRRRQHTGHVEVLFRTGASALVFLEGGGLVHSLYTEADGTTLSGRAALQRTLEQADAAGATIGVYQASGETMARTDPAALDGALAPDGGRAVFDALEALLQKLEVAVDAVAGPGAFALALRRAMDAQSERYPFLDPFEGLFEFRDGRLAFHGQEPPRVVVCAVWECLRQAVDALAADPALAARGVRERVRTVALAQARELPAEFRSWGIDPGALAPGG